MIILIGRLEKTKIIIAFLLNYTIPATVVFASDDLSEFAEAVDCYDWEDYDSEQSTGIDYIISNILHFYLILNIN